MCRCGFALFIIQALLLPTYASGLAQGAGRSITDANLFDPGFDPEIEASLSTPAGFQLSRLHSSDTPTDSQTDLGLHSPLVHAPRAALANPASSLATDLNADGLATKLDIEPVTFNQSTPALAPTHEFTLESSSGVPDISAPLTTGFSMGDVPVYKRFSFGGRGWQRELDPGFRATVFGAEAKLGLTRRVDLRLGLELLQTDPHASGIPSTSDDSLYAQFRFRF